MTWTVLLLFAGAVAAERTLLHTFALAADYFAADVGFNRPGSITLSSYAGIAARHGKAVYAKFIGALFFNANHCEEAMVADVGRACDSLNILLANDALALAMIASLRQRTPQP